MKKHLAILLHIVILLCIISCKTTKTEKPQYSAKEADYALHYALQISCQRAGTKLKSQLEKIDYIPPEYKTIQTEQQNIPGMPTLISQLTTYYSQYIGDFIEDFSAHVQMLANSLEFQNPVYMSTYSNTSTSTELKNTHNTEIQQYLKQYLDKTDNTLFNWCINQYNAYTITSKQIENKTLLEQKSISNHVSEMVTQQFFNILKDTEDLYRTTPDPYADDIAGKVFGIN